METRLEPQPGQRKRFYDRAGLQVSATDPDERLHAELKCEPRIRREEVLGTMTNNAYFLD